MRSYWIIPIVAVFVCVSTVLEALDAETQGRNDPPQRLSYANNANDKVPTRLVRTTDDEERGPFKTSTMKSAISKLRDFLHLKLGRLFIKPESVFKRFQVGQVGDLRSDSDRVRLALATLQRSEMKRLIKLFALQKKSLIQAFTKYYGDDIMAEALVLARESGKERTKDIAKKLSIELMEQWQKSGESNLSIFKLLKIHDNALLSRNIGSPKLKMLYDFIELENGKSSGKVWIETLIKGFQGEDKFALLIAESKSNPSLSESEVRIVEKLETEYFKTLLSMQNFNANDLFTRLKLKEEGVRALISRKLELLNKFIKQYNLENPGRRAYLLRVLKNGFGGYGKFAVLIAMAQKSPSTILQEKGAALEESLFRRMWMKRMDPDAFKKKLWKVDNRETELASAIWKRYMIFWVKCQMKMPGPNSESAPLVRKVGSKSIRHYILSKKSKSD
ncbi:hypothetical protein PsorP6_016250 [Peronosclerospora sorghi]|uniref:Uncharacterized protein n=1 Tax=Peronosclerospora sorghi TaxID=230839 RepID=A0ACC0VSP3_9STRA|nr:hypothetical protein PsorP6_016250 [Peronosclerospora sorghi]